MEAETDVDLPTMNASAVVVVGTGHEIVLLEGTAEEAEEVEVEEEEEVEEVTEEAEAGRLVVDIAARIAATAGPARRRPPLGRAAKADRGHHPPPRNPRPPGRPPPASPPARPAPSAPWTAAAALRERRMETTRAP